VVFDLSPFQLVVFDLSPFQLVVFDLSPFQLVVFDQCPIRLIVVEGCLNLNYHCLTGWSNRNFRHLCGFLRKQLDRWLEEVSLTKLPPLKQ
jgi:hypothetical protein